MIGHRHVLIGVCLVELLVLLGSCQLAECAGGRLTIGGPIGTITGRTSGSGNKQAGSVYSQHGAEQQQQAITNFSESHHQDLIRVHELGGEAVRWRGVKSASDLAPESQVVSVQFGQWPLFEAVSSKLPLRADDQLRAKMSPNEASNKTKQSQEFETHQEQQQQQVATSSERPPEASETPPGSTPSPLDQSTASQSTPQVTTTSQTESGSTLSPSPTTTTTTTTSTTTTSSSTTDTPPGWPAQPEKPPSSTTTTTTTTTTELPPTSVGPVGGRVEREGDAVLCGEANANGKSNKRLISDRIVGGHKTEPGEFPFQVRLNIRSRRGSGICGGVVLDRWHVLTAAHCMTACVSHQLTTATIESTGVRVTVGDHSIKSDDGELELEVETITPHEKYDACNFYANDHDIALIKTAAPIPFKFTTDGYGSVNRPCMPPSGDLQYRDGEMVIVSGWGVTRENSGALSNILRYVQVPVVNVTRCQETYGSRVTQDHVCAGFQAGGKDSCQGDSGGPLVRVVDNRYELVGIVSFGYGCGQAGAAGVYTKVASYLDWIKANTNLNLS